MNKKNQDILLEEKNHPKNEVTDLFKTKTTNVNILLNRVRLNKKNDLKKKLFGLFTLVLVLSLITFYALI